MKRKITRRQIFGGLTETLAGVCSEASGINYRYIYRYIQVYSGINYINKISLVSNVHNEGVQTPV